MTVSTSLLIMRVHGYQVLSVQTASMTPTFRPGDAIVVRPVTAAQLRLGDIVSYHSSYDRKAVISHRLIAIDRQTGWLTTAGDALSRPDPAVASNRVIGRAVAMAPRLGGLLDILRQPLGLMLAVYLPAVMLIIVETWRLVSIYARPFYSVRL